MNQNEQRRHCLQEFRFTDLFTQELGWDYFSGQLSPAYIDDQVFLLEPVAEKARFVVLQCTPLSGDEIPSYPVRRKIDRHVTKLHYEHLIIFTDAARSEQIWQWVKRERGKPDAVREHRLFTSQGGQVGLPLAQRLNDFVFTLEDEMKGVNITDVSAAVTKALDIEKVTKRFYERFREELTRFQKFIIGFTDLADRDWYASLMLNRMMFVYFIQKQGFLDGDVHYLPNRLQTMQAEGTGATFQQFYRKFLLRLFHEGLGQPKSHRDANLNALLGDVPFLNGGLFERHELEQGHPVIAIPDEAFEKIFEFFDCYRWHLDERPDGDDNEINPDVLGYIFEKYINQKQMGAYYTKEDITGYISRNTVIPHLFDAAKQECPVAFEPDGGVWRLLRDDPDRYIYPAVGHGTTWNARDHANPVRLEAPVELPDDIAAGLDDASLRGGWNELAPESIGLPTETFREAVARRQRHAEVRGKLSRGEVTEINELITLNLDIERFALDVIAQSEGPELLRAIWKAIRSVSVLDPTCGSGAFLFAALNILEPLYSVCIEGMQGFVNDLERTERLQGANALKDFRTVLEEDQQHPNRNYFVLKSIVLNNLYGVDIMEEAVEICKVRLFLKLVAQLKSAAHIEPLPDIDFNIRAGNTLVGYTSLDAVRDAMRTGTVDGATASRMLSPAEEEELAAIEEQAQLIAESYQDFREQQTETAGTATAASKAEHKQWLDDLVCRLDHLQAREYGIDPDDAEAYQEWREGHRPFHWFAEFYGIMSSGGFDVVIGNPPYVEYSKVKSDYTISGYQTIKCGNLYAYVIERSYDCMQAKSRFGMIVQLSFSCTERMKPVQDLSLRESAALWLSHYDDRPAKLFHGLEHIRATIAISEVSDDSVSKSTVRASSTHYRRWQAKARPHLFNTTSFEELPQLTSLPAGTLPKAGTELDKAILHHLTSKQKLSALFDDQGDNVIYFHNAPQYWVRATDFKPHFWNQRDGHVRSSHLKTLRFATEIDAAVATAALNSSVYYYWFLLLSNGRDLTSREIAHFPISPRSMNANMKLQLKQLTEELMRNFRDHSQRKETRYKATGRVSYDEFNQKPSKPIIDKIDRKLADHYGLTEEELDFIINYDIKYRMGLGKS